MRDAIFKTRSREGGGVTVTAANRARKGAVGGRRVLADGRRASYESLSLFTYSLLTGTPLSVVDSLPFFSVFPTSIC